MKTLQECKDKVAKEQGFYSWDICLAGRDLNMITKVMNLAAELYAQQFKDELEQGAEYVVRLSDSIVKLCDENSRLLEEKAKLIEKINAWKEHEKQAMYPSYYYTGRTDALNNVLQLLTSPQ